ncbi:MAG: hypothetical protein ABSB79_09295 [Syntrophales bacterium]|jgi:putative sterol carrier protein
MAVFKNTEEMYKMLGDLWNHIIFEVKLGEKLKEFDVTIKFVIKDPTGFIWISHDKVILGDEANKDATITMELSGDTVHKYWLKQISLPVALATRAIKSKGPIPKVLKMLPYLKPVFEAYPTFCKKHGIPI